MVEGMRVLEQPGVAALGLCPVLPGGCDVAAV